MATLPTNVDYTTAVHHSIAKWAPTFGDVMTSRTSAATAIRQPSGQWELHLGLVRGDGVRFTTSVPFNADGPAVVRDGELVRWGVERLGPGVWALTPSVHAEGHYHGYVVLRDVPEPAPWLR